MSGEYEDFMTTIGVRGEPTLSERLRQAALEADFALMQKSPARSDRPPMPRSPTLPDFYEALGLPEGGVPARPTPTLADFEREVLGGGNGAPPTGTPLRESSPAGMVSLREGVVRQSSWDIDPAAGIVRGVKVLGYTSKHGRRYLKEAVGNALHLYEGAKVNIDHVPPSRKGEPRPYAERFGRLRNVRLGPDGPVADLHYNPKHPLAESFVWWAKNDPGACGLSHDAFGRSKTGADGVEEVYEIRAVNSVDLVADGATTSGLYEGMGSGGKREVTLADFLKAVGLS